MLQAPRPRTPYKKLLKYVPQAPNPRTLDPKRVNYVAQLGSKSCSQNPKGCKLQDPGTKPSCPRPKMNYVPQSSNLRTLTQKLCE